jgi:hypothetical protein
MRLKKTALRLKIVCLRAGYNLEGNVKKFFFASTSLCYDPIQATLERGVPVSCHRMYCEAWPL